MVIKLFIVIIQGNISIISYTMHGSNVSCLREISSLMLSDLSYEIQCTFALCTHFDAIFLLLWKWNQNSVSLQDISSKWNSFIIRMGGGANDDMRIRRIFHSCTLVEYTLLNIMNVARQHKSRRSQNNNLLFFPPCAFDVNENSCVPHCLIWSVDWCLLISIHYNNNSTYTRKNRSKCFKINRISLQVSRLGSRLKNRVLLHLANEWEYRLITHIFYWISKFGFVYIRFSYFVVFNFNFSLSHPMNDGIFCCCAVENK